MDPVQWGDKPSMKVCPDINLFQLKSYYTWSQEHGRQEVRKCPS